jgi:hypothetical protein
MSDKIEITKKNKKYKQNDRQNWHVKKNDNKKDKKNKIHITYFDFFQPLRA